MVQLPGNPFDLEAIYDLANSQGVDYWIGLGVNIILSTIVGGIILIIIMEVLGRKTGVSPRTPGSAFLLVLAINIINFIGVLGIGIPVLYQLGIGGILLQVLIWIALIKLAFREYSIPYAIILGIIGYFVTSYLTGIVIGLIAGFLQF